MPLSTCLVSIAIILNAPDTHSGYKEASYDLDPAYKEPGKGEESEMAFQHAISISPSYHASLFNLGKFYAESGQFQKAMPFHENSKKENESHFGALLFLEWSSYQQEYSKKSHTILKKAEEQQPRIQKFKRLPASCEGGNSACFISILM